MPPQSRLASDAAERCAAHVLVVSAIRIYREGLQIMLERSGAIECVGSAGDSQSAVAAARRLRPDVALIDVTMPDALAAVRAMPPGLRTVALGVGPDDREVVGFAEAGVAGYLTRDDSLDCVADALAAVARGEALCPPEIGAVLLRRVTALGPMPMPRVAPDARLTAREVEIIELIDQGLPNKTIAQRLCIELPTVKNHVHHVFEKLGVSRREEAAVWLRDRRAHDTLAARARRD